MCAADLTSFDVSNTVDSTICDGASISFGTQTITTAGPYQEVFTNSRGCDSTVDLTVTVNSTYDETVNLTGCPADTGTVVQDLFTTSGCDSVVTIITSLETTAPTAVCQDITIQLDAGSSASHTAAAINDGSSDACGIASISASPTSYGCEELGGNTSTLTVTDNNGNSGSCSANVTVVDPLGSCVNPCAPDLTDPIAACQDITIQLNASGNASIIAADIDDGSSDFCGIDSLYASPSAYTCANVGGNTSTLTVTDIGGNQVTCTSTVTVEDNVAPTASCQNVTVSLDASGNYSDNANAVDNGSSDACGVNLSAFPAVIAAFPDPSR